MEKIFISARDLLADSVRLAAKIYQSGFRPDCIAGIWRGGTPVGITVHEYFAYRGIATDHVAIKTASYTGIDQRSKTISVCGLSALLDSKIRGANLLIVDDVFDTGLSMEAVLTQLREETGEDGPGTIRIACPWYKPARNQTQLRPDYYLHETDRWIVFPHELIGLTADEIRRCKPDLIDVLYDLDL